MQNHKDDKHPEGTKDHKDQREDRKQSSPAPKNKEALSTEDLDQVAGGINPQPLPPGRNRAGQ